MKSKKLLYVFLILLSAVALSGCVLNNKSKSVDDLVKNTPVKAESTNILSDFKSGINVEIGGVKRENNKTAVEVKMNNHQYDLTKMNILGLSELNKVKASNFIIESSAMGGHHVTGNLIFSGSLYGPLTIGLSSDLIFNFNIQ